MSVLGRLGRVLRPSRDDAERARIRQYEAFQRDVCKTARAAFVPPDYSKLVALAPAVLSGHRRVRGSRHRGETVEWYILADDQPMPPIDELSLQHLHHLATIREDLLLYVALPFGWSFAVLDDDERSWAAFSPADQVRGYIRDFLAGDTSTSTAEAIKDIVEESFAESPIASLLSRSLGRYVAVGSELDDLRALLQTAQAELVGDAVR